MPNRRSPFTRRAAAVALATGLLLTACTATVEDDAAPTPTPTASPDASEGSAAPLPEASATPTPTATTTPTPSPEEDVTTPWTRPSAPYGGSRTVPAQSVDTHEASGSSRDNGSGSPSTGDVDPAPEPVPAPDADPELSKTHDDTVEIRSDLGEISFAYDGASSGEDFAYQGQSWDSGDNRLTLDVQGTHDGEDSVASWYNGQTGGAAVHTDIDTNDEPQELHYAFCGTLTFLDYGSASVETCFGQGDSGLENNWWMGGADFGRVGGICHVDADAADAQATSLVACLDSDGLSSNEFEVSMGDAHANYFSLYSLSDLPPLALAPLGTAITNFVDSDPPNLTTAEAIAKSIGLEPTLQSWLCEIQLPSLQGQTSEQVQEYFADFLAINPKGRVPALVTERGILSETPAILLFIAQSFPQAGLAPLNDPFATAQLQAFNNYLCSTVHVAHAHGGRGQTLRCKGIES